MLDLDILVVSDVEDYGAEYFMKIKYWHRDYKRFIPDSTTVDHVLVKKQHLDNWFQV